MPASTTVVTSSYLKQKVPKDSAGVLKYMLYFGTLGLPEPEVTIWSIMLAMATRYAPSPEGERVSELLSVTLSIVAPDAGRMVRGLSAEVRVVIRFIPDSRLRGVPDP